ncbi:hypothetical protein MUK42_14391 [Musa troglodytarum]|uniref:Uncharacterized protein n=1 Tax=Musa troglodytarum TaxID=320322 RepID=A0A9E7L7W5_9LILI|nr:hypothetical protein MUK42_14391 [Musa troglodytarum]
MISTEPRAGSTEEHRPASHRVRNRSRSESRYFSNSACPSSCPRSSAIPFSWEQRPGIPKSLSHSAAAEDASAHPLLPLPPPVRSDSELSTTRKKRSAASPDPFAAALAVCSNGLPHDGDDVDELCLVPDAAPQRAASIADRFRLFDLYGSCKAACSVVDATVRLPRTGSLAFLGRRPGPDNI